MELKYGTSLGCFQTEILAAGKRRRRKRSKRRSGRLLLFTYRLQTMDGWPLPEHQSMLPLLWIWFPLISVFSPPISIFHHETSSASIFFYYFMKLLPFYETSIFQSRTNAIPATTLLLAFSLRCCKQTIFNK